MKIDTENEYRDEVRMNEKLTEYRKKRDFGKTEEPSGESGRTDGGRTPLKFAVQYHLARRAHYDLRLEWQGVLLSWAVPKGPSYNPADKRLAVRVEDHPIEYADFEGVIPKGEYGGGTVLLWDEGIWTPQDDFADGLKKGSIKIALAGSRLKGKWALVRLRDDAKSTDNWLLIKENDEFALTEEGIKRFDTGIRSGRTARQIDEEENAVYRRNPFETAPVQLAKLADTLPEGDGWLYEIKYDGYRMLAYTEGGRTRLLTRNGHDYTEKFPALAASLTGFAAGRAAVLDGELIATDGDGRPDFQALQSYVKKPDGKTLTYVVFDLMALDGEDLRGLPLLERKTRLLALLQTPPAFVCLSRYTVGRGKEFFEAAERLGLEGIVGKKSDSPYRGARNGDWIKLKCTRRQEFVIGGYTLSDKKTSGVSALLLGYYEDGALAYAGRAGTGMSRSGQKELEKKFHPFIVKKSPFAAGPKPKSGERFFWLKPKWIAEVRFAEFTTDNLLRQAGFKGLRDDKNPEEVVMEKAEKAWAAAEQTEKAEKASAAAEQTEKAEKAPAAAKQTEKAEKPTKVPPPNKKKGEETVVSGVKISNPEKSVFLRPEVKKIEVLQYYRTVWPRMQTYAAGRVLSVVRCHRGVSACFYKKHPATQSAGVAVIPVKNSAGGFSDYFYIENEKGLISEVQLGSLEFHIWGSRAENLEKPDMMVFDLDPDEGMEPARVRQGVRDLKGVLDDFSLRSFLKTSGGKGYHVVVPFLPVVGWDKFRDFAKGIASLMEKKWPDRYTANMRKIRRKGRIFIDWARNGRGATGIAPYSLRARPGARVSMPIAWSELDSVSPDGVDLFGALDRLKKSDPWKEFSQTEQRLKP